MEILVLLTVLGSMGPIKAASAALIVLCATIWRDRERVSFGLTSVGRALCWEHLIPTK